MNTIDRENLNERELVSAIEEKRDALRIARFSFSVGKLKSNDQYTKLRKDLARLLTEKRRRDGKKSNES